MFRKSLAASGVALAAFAFAACSAPSPAADTGKTPDTAPVESAPTPEASTPAPESEFGEKVLSTRGNMIKQIGQLAGTGISGDPDTIGSRFVVTDIVLDPVCDSGWSDTPANGHYLALHINVETTPELAQSDNPEVWFSPYDWQSYDPHGKRLNDPVGNAWSCMSEAATLPSSVGPGQSVSGYIVLDVAATTGTVVMTLGGGPTGWEWDY
ncbi:hypothetical protein [Microbacterium sp. KRD172]|uniref:hypothetical protein n=1 Tax=Microbacterium sp. KRD172 TaxID=2729727 RepID=UPI0019D1EEB7|nr:hypothetical protein [Microbacterium sp. KRD172]